MTHVALNSRQSSLVFRALLQSLASPGETFSLPAELCSAVPARALPLLALVDIETTFCAPEDADLELSVASPELAQFALCATPPSHTFVSRLQRGNASQPERGCKLIIGLHPDVAVASVTLSGPGVRPGTTIAADSQLSSFIAARNTVVAEPPSGIDCWFVSPDGRLVGLPRTTRAETR
jgi:alpha-D-ribose 1-methylphosphonate 5-triphosphate synthase subunit PhnH